jgi:hypothetical protein
MNDSRYTKTAMCKSNAKYKHLWHAGALRRPSRLNLQVRSSFYSPILSPAPAHGRDAHTLLIPRQARVGPFICHVIMMSAHRMHMPIWRKYAHQMCAPAHTDSDCHYTHRSSTGNGYGAHARIQSVQRSAVAAWAGITPQQASARAHPPSARNKTRQHGRGDQSTPGRLEIARNRGRRSRSWTRSGSCYNSRHYPR